MLAVVVRLSFVYFKEKKDFSKCQYFENTKKEEKEQEVRYFILVSLETSVITKAVTTAAPNTTTAVVTTLITVIVTVTVRFIRKFARWWCVDFLVVTWSSFSSFWLWSCSVSIRSRLFSKSDLSVAFRCRFLEFSMF